MTYVELHCHSAYSFLDGASQPEELAARAAELGYEALALTDHDGVCGSLEFAHAAKVFGVRPITGAELTLADGSHVTLLVETPRGYANLCRLITAAHAETRPKPTELLPPALPLELLLELERRARLPLRLRPARARQCAIRTAPRASRRRSGRTASTSSSSARTSAGTRRRNAALRDLAEALGVRTVVSGDVHAHSHERAVLQDALVAIRNCTSLEGCEPARRGNWESILLPPAELVERFPDDRDAVGRTRELAERLEFDLTQELGYRYPDFSDASTSSRCPARAAL